MSITVTVELPDGLVDLMRSARYPTVTEIAGLWRLVGDALPPPPPAPGVRVRSRTSERGVGLVLAVEGSYAWVQWSGGSIPQTVALDAIARIVDEVGS